MVRRKPGKLFEDKNIQRITVKGKNMYEKIYIGKKKEKSNLVIPIEKKNTRNWLVKRKKNTVRSAKLQCKMCSILSRSK